MHPLLYGIEGALTPVAQERAAVALPLFWRALDRVLSAAMPHGLPRESPSGTAVRRLDAAAQCVRAAYLLEGCGHRWSADRDAVQAMLLAIVHYTSPEGSLPFAAGAGTIRSVWTAMFAEQALSLALLDPGDPFLREAARWIV